MVILFTIKNKYRFLVKHYKKITKYVIGFVFILFLMNFFIQELDLLKIFEKNKNQIFLTGIVCYMLYKFILSKSPNLVISPPSTYYLVLSEFKLEYLILIKIINNYLMQGIFLLILFLELKLIGFKNEMGLNYFNIFFILMYLNNLQWISYNMYSKLKKFFYTLVIFFTTLFLIKINSLILWIILSITSLIICIKIVQNINWEKLLKHSEYAYYSLKYFLSSDFAGLYRISLESKKIKQQFNLFNTFNFLGWKTIFIKEMTLNIRKGFLVWIFFVLETIFLIWLLTKTKFIFMLGGISLYFTFVNFFSHTIGISLQKEKKGLLIPLSTIDSFRGYIIFPIIVTSIIMSITTLVIKPNFYIIRLLILLLISNLAVITAIMDRCIKNKFITKFTIFSMIIFLSILYSSIYISILCLILIFMISLVIFIILIKETYKYYEERFKY